MSRRVLGRGLDALIPNSQTETEPRAPEGNISDGEVKWVSIREIVPNPRQPRTEFDPEKLAGLSQSIRDMGVLEPLIVRRRDDGRLELVAGERRLRAAQQAGLANVPVLIREFEGRKALEVALIENLQREDLNPVEEARAYLLLTEEFGRTHEQISRDVGKDRSTVSNLLRLLRLPQAILEDVSRGTLSTGHARVLLGLETDQDQVTMAHAIVREGWSVRKAEREVARALSAKKRKRQEEKKPQPSGSSLQREVARIEEALRYALGTQVHMRHNGDGGSFEVTYASREELERILDLLGIQIH